MSSYLRCIQHLFLPTINQVNVIVYENGKRKDVSMYDSHRLNELLQSINALWKSPENSSYWFETAAWEERSCFKRPVLKILTTCYKEDVFSKDMKKKMAIPMRYRKKLFDQYHTIHPELLGTHKWPQEISVRFSLQEI